MFSKKMGMKDSNEVEVVAILEALWILSSLFHENLIIKSDSSNAISWASSLSVDPWKFHFHLVKIKFVFLLLSDVRACKGC